jgi:hypothetical protein
VGGPGHVVVDWGINWKALEKLPGATWPDHASQWRSSA